MRRFALALSLLLAVPAVCLSATPLRGIGDLAPNPILWKASDNDSEVWLLGSIHLLPEGVPWRTDKIQQAIQRASVVYFETDITKASADTYTRYSGDRRVIDLSYKLGPENWRQLATLVEEAGLSLGDFFYVQPWYAKHVLVDALGDYLGAQMKYGVDYMIERDVRRSGKEVRYLESIEQQISAIAAAPEDEALADLVSYIQQNGRDDTNFGELLQSWYAGDANSLDTEIRRQITSDAVYNAVIVQRNENWVEQIVELMDGEGSALIVVGTGHLVGEHSVPEMLRKKGYFVTRQ